MRYHVLSGLIPPIITRHALAYNPTNALTIQLQEMKIYKTCGINLEQLINAHARGITFTVMMQN